VYLALLLVALLIVAGCGQRAADKAAEGMLSATTGERIKVDSDSESFTITG